MKDQQLTTILVILGALIFVYSVFANIDIPVHPIDENIVACTEEAKICPDGSIVVRSLPSCEFDPCPIADTQETYNDNSNPESIDICTKNGGVYDNKNKECLGIDQNTCEGIGGTFNECASPCRHDPEAEICVLSCEILCQL